MTPDCQEPCILYRDNYSYEMQDADNRTMVNIVFNSSYIYFNSDKVKDKKSGKVYFGVEC